MKPTQELSHEHQAILVLFPMADARLTAAQQAELAACFSDVEERVIGHGKHEEYHRLLKELESAYLT